MPDLPECRHSPFLDDPEIVGAALSSGHRRYCDQLDPDHPAFNPGIVRAYRAMSLNLMGRTEPRPAPVPLAESIRVARAVRACPHRGVARCGCAALARCALGKGKGGEVSYSECCECVATNPVGG